MLTASSVEGFRLEAEVKEKPQASRRLRTGSHRDWGARNESLSGREVMEAHNTARERRRSSISLAIPVCSNPMAASVEIGQDEVDFEAHGVKISQDGLFIDGANVSEVHHNDLRVLSELGRGACSVVKKAQVRGGRVEGLAVQRRSLGGVGAFRR